tara:strand:+ start:1096 stop:1341 length:246 start_codon:yes stop_codon:yes gene_type:complete
MNEGMENIKTIESLEEENLKLKKEIDRLNEELQLIEIIERDHKELNGKMHTELAKLKIANKELEKKVMEFVRPTKRSIDDL